MFVYTIPADITFSPPTFYPSSRYTVTPSAPTPRERYLQAVAEAQAARTRYLFEIEEQSILASLQAQETLRQVYFRQPHTIPVQYGIDRRRARHIHVENLCRPTIHLQGRRPILARQQRGNFLPIHKLHEYWQESTLPLNPYGGDSKCMTRLQSYKPEVRVDEARTRDMPPNGYFVIRIKHVPGTIQADQIAPTSQSNNPPTADPVFGPLSHQPKILHNRLTREYAARTIQQQWRTHSENALARNDALTTIATLQARFQFISDTFSLPEHLEFREHVADQERKAPTLLFTEANAAVHAYINELNKLLTLIDAVPSHGSLHVRKERRSLVRLVEEALDSVDRGVATVWENRIKASTDIRSGSDSLETPVPPIAVQVPGEPVIHSSESNLSVNGVDSPISDPNPMKSSSMGFSTIIPSRGTTHDDLPALDDLEVPHDTISQNVPSERRDLDCLPTLDDPSIHHDASIIDPIQENHDVAVEIKYEDADTVEVTKALDIPDISLTSTSIMESTEVTGLDVVPTFARAGLTAGSPVLGLTTAESFDVVYPDSQPSSPPKVESHLDHLEPSQTLSTSIKEESHGLNEVENHDLSPEVEEAFELL